ncbi:MAG: hypothetical protein AAF502_23135 [Bacteroidota bacterium]
MKTIVVILTSFMLCFLAIQQLTGETTSVKGMFQDNSINMNRKKVAEVLRKIKDNNETKYINQQSLYINA